jgi:hypothetical protein
MIVMLPLFLEVADGTGVFMMSSVAHQARELVRMLRFTIQPRQADADVAMFEFF